MLTEEQIKEIEQALECYEEADDMDRRQRARFVIDLHAPDWVGLFISDVRTLKQQNKQLVEALEWYGTHSNYVYNTTITYNNVLVTPAQIDRGMKARETLQQIQGKEEPR